MNESLLEEIRREIKVKHSCRKTISRKLFLLFSSCPVQFLIVYTQPLHLARGFICFLCFATNWKDAGKFWPARRKFAASTARSVPALIKELSANPSVPMFQFKNFQRSFHPLLHLFRSNNYLLPYQKLTSHRFHSSPTFFFLPFLFFLSQQIFQQTIRLIN